MKTPIKNPSPLKLGEESIPSEACRQLSARRFSIPSTLVAMLLCFSAHAFALVGGPFDNGDYSQAMDLTGIYQWTATFTNGLGQGQFSSSASVAGSSSSSSTSTGNSNIGTTSERSIFYYKGVTFFGGCFGVVDVGGKTISCVTNGQSDVGTGSSSSTSSSTTTTGTASNVDATTTIVNNGSLGFVANSQWSGKITKTSPTLEFEGEGELTVLSPSVQPLLSTLAQQIVQSASGSNTVNVASALSVLSNSDFLNAVTPQTLSEVSDAADTVHISVSGTRKYFQ